MEKLEFNFSDTDFKKISGLVTGYSGIMLPEQKKMLVYSRLVKRLRALNLTSFAEYTKKLEQEAATGQSNELINVVNAMTTNVTHFFREEHHFTLLKEELIKMAKEFGAVKVWSCASSTGEEPWSIAMVIAEVLQQNPSLQISLRASDLDTGVLQKAKKGAYVLSQNQVSTHKYLKRYLKKTGEPLKTPLGEDGFLYEVTDELRKLITFEQINLVKPFPPGLKAHIIFCRNVIIYFDKETKRDLLQKMAKIVPKGGLLVIGHSESLMGISEEFSGMGKTAYRRK